MPKSPEEYCYLCHWTTCIAQDGGRVKRVYNDTPGFAMDTYFLPNPIEECYLRPQELALREQARKSAKKEKGGDI